jgi:protein SCO1/2
MIKKVTLLLSICLYAVSGMAQFNELPPELRDVGIVEKLGDRIPSDVIFTNELGETVTMADFLASGKPLIITPIYYECPMLCNLIINGLTDGLKQLGWKVGDEFEIVTFSIDPDESYELAASKKAGYIRLLGNPDAAKGWHFLTADQENINKITDALGFNFKWSDQAQEFLHGSSIMFVSPNGIITRYLYGIEYTQLSLRNALFDAAEGRIGSVVDRVMLFCYTYDPDSRSYVANAINIMKIGGVLTLSFLSIFLGILWFRHNASKTINA